MCLLSITGNYCHTKGITTDVLISFETCTNCFVQTKKGMLDKGSYNNLEYPYDINNVYINEYGDWYYFDISNSSKDIRKLRHD